MSLEPHLRVSECFGSIAGPSIQALSVRVWLELLAEAKAAEALARDLRRRRYLLQEGPGNSIQGFSFC